jgi:diguanylate cyclase (GGDEF)-like protein
VSRLSIAAILSVRSVSPRPRERRINPLRLRAFSLNWRWGIGERLSLAFIAVAGFALAANLLTEHVISFTHTMRTVRTTVPVSPQLAPVTPNLATASLPMISAIGHYEVGVLSRVGLRHEDSDAQLTNAIRELDQETRAFVSQPRSAGATHQAEDLQARLAAYRLLGDELVRFADGRQKVLKEFWHYFETLDARTKASLARSWKMFGRVIARKSVVDLNSSLDEIRRGFAGLSILSFYDQDSLHTVKLSENALADSLRDNELALTRSQGEEWLTQMRADLTRLNELQNSLISLDSQRRRAEAKFAVETQEIMTLVKAMSLPLVVRGGGVKALLQPAPDGARLAAGPSSEHTTERTSTTEQKPESFGPIFWVSAAILMLLMWLCVRTFMSVVGPVRRMRAATLRLAAGEGGVQVARGGIRELDDLAISFNQMARQLADAKAMARNYQERLEAKVNLRTRELQHLAEHDPLTQLPNRRQLFTHLKGAITRAEAGGSFVGVFFVDLDNFKNINDSLGHAFGDLVLSAIAGRLRARAGPAGFAARLGGDEFTIVCDGMSVEGVNAFGSELVLAFQQPIAVDGRYLMISISVGASLYPDHGSDAEELLRAADAALFRAKALGRSQLTVFSPALLEAASAKFSTEQGLRYALERGEFELVFQPEIDATTLTMRLVESLLRWRLPDGRLASPSEFLAIAEESGLIMEISDWVLRSSIEAAAHWHHGAWPEARVAINLSSRQLLDARFIERVMDLLREHRLPARCIEIELTENVLQTGAATIEVLRQLRDHDVAIALDDFGIGYSSLASLEQLPLTRVKLDRALIASIHLSTRSAAIARALVGLCHNIGLEVTAEGIECTEQLALLAELAPIHLQGYLLARPVPAECILSLMESLPNHLTSLLLAASPTTPAAHHPHEKLKMAGPIALKR